MSELIGIVGAALILLAWFTETIKEMKKHKSLVDIQFSVVTLVGSILLAAYAHLIADPVFFWLSAIISLIIVIEIVYTLHVSTHRRRR